MSSTSSLSPRAARTRAALIHAGFELLVERPIDAIPIDDLVAKAGVGKGSFFNHFADKQAFAEAIATEVRLELEEQITRANAPVRDPLARIAQGMRVGAEFAIANPGRAIVLLRSPVSSADQAHPLNKGVAADFAAACSADLLRPEAVRTGVTYWLGLCHMLMVHLIDQRSDRAGQQGRIRDMITLGLTGLGVSDGDCQQILASIL